MKTNQKLSICVLFALVFSITHGNTIFGQCYASALSPSTINAPYGGGQYTVAVTTSGCFDYNISNYTNFATYSKNGLMVHVTVQANSGTARSGIMLIGSRPLTVNQACGNFPSPPTSASSNPSSVCSNRGGTISLSASGGSGTSLWWTTGSCGGTSLGSGNPLVTASPTSTTTYYAHWQNDCGNSTCTSVTVTVLGLPTPSSSNNGPICEGSDLHLTSSGGVSYSWTGPNSFTSSLQNPTITAATTSASGAYYVTVTNSNGCSAQAGTSVTVRSRPSHTASSNSPVCVGNTINLSSYFGGTYAWTGPNNYTATGQNPSITNAATVNAGNYTVTITDSYGCWSQATTNVIVNTLPAASASSNSPVCYGATINLYGSGGSSYSWTGPNSFTSTLQNPSITNATSINGGRYSVTVSNGCSSSTSTTVTVHDLVSGGVIVGDQTICYSTDAANITSTSPASGGAGSFTYAWEYSVDGGNSWSDAGGNSTSFDPPILTTTTKYMRKATDASCGIAYTTPVTKTVRSAFSGGYIATNQTVCYNADPAPFTSVSLASGGSGTYTYSWEKSTDNGVTWVSAGGISTTFDPSMLTTTTQYQRRATDSNWGCQAISNKVTVTVRLQLGGGTISGDETICYGTDAGNITGTIATGGSESYSYSWEKSENGGTSWNNAGGGGLTFDPANLVTTTLFRRNTADNVCQSSAYSINNATKTVRVETFPGTISGEQTIFYNTVPSSLINVESATGGAGSLTYQWWQSINDGTSWTPISGASAADYSPSSIIINTKYRRAVTDNANSCIFTSNDIKKTVTIFASPDATKNYIYTREPNTAVTALGALTTPDEYKSSIQYFDGLGRPDQNIQVVASSSYGDIITPIYYDAFGRETAKYLPFSKSGDPGSYVSGAIGQQRQFYNASSYFPGDTSNAKTVFEDSPLNRTLEQGAPGKSWQPYDASDTTSGHTMDMRLWRTATAMSYFGSWWEVSLVDAGGDTINLSNYYTYEYLSIYK